MKGTQKQKMKNLETYDVKHQNPRLIKNVTYLKNYKATNL